MDVEFIRSELSTTQAVIASVVAGFSGVPASAQGVLEDEHARFMTRAFGQGVSDEGWRDSTVDRLERFNTRPWSKPPTCASDKVGTFIQGVD